MSDLISRKAAIDALANELYHNEEDCRTAVKAIGGLPSAEPEIIRCKDCKWCVEHFDTDGNEPYWICKNWDAGIDADGFCYEAERRTDE